MDRTGINDNHFHLDASAVNQLLGTDLAGRTRPLRDEPSL